MTEQDRFAMSHHTLYAANPRSIAHQPLAHINMEHPYDQAYGHYLMLTVRDPDSPGAREGHHYMVDTYLIDKCAHHAKDMDGRIASIASLDYVSDSQLSQMGWSCHYRSICELTKEVAGLFEPLCDLREMRHLKASERGHYDPSDCVFGAHLARELGYSWTFGDVGIDLVRKDADIVGALKADQLAREMLRAGALLPHDSYSWRIADFERYVFENRDDPKVVDVYERWRDRIAETLAFAEATRDDSCPGQMSLFDDED